MGSRASTPSASSAHTNAPRPTPRSFADALSRPGLSQPPPARQVVRRNPSGKQVSSPVKSKQGLPPATGHPSLRVNTHQPLAVRSATPATTAAPSISSAAAPSEPHTDESVGHVPVELASLVTSEAAPFRKLGTADAGPSTSSALRLLKPLGFENKHNMCFCIAPLQALLATSEFSKLMEHLIAVEHLIPLKVEVLKGFTDFALQLDEAGDKVRSTWLLCCTLNALALACCLHCFAACIGGLLGGRGGGNDYDCHVCRSIIETSYVVCAGNITIASP